MDGQILLHSVLKHVSFKVMGVPPTRKGEPTQMLTVPLTFLATLLLWFKTKKPYYGPE